MNFLTNFNTIFAVVVVVVVGFSGREVAVYCATHLAEIIKSTTAYGDGNVGQAMKDAFMQCDRLLTERETIEEMKKYDEDVISEEE